jgi:citrate/tricarballylate utilization protein
MLAVDQHEEAARLMTICNSCRYCEGICAVFPAIELRRSFATADLNYLANLCHGCGACYVDCQFSPPHEFDVNVPRTLAEVRAASYRSYAWPAFLRPMFDRNGLIIAVATASSVAAFILGFALWHDRAALFAGDGHFYRLMPHEAMAGLFGVAFLFAVVALAMSFRNFWQEIGARSVAAGSGTTLWSASRDAASLRYLDGGGAGCYNEDDRPTDNRRLFHHLTFYGFMLCFASTSAATIYHYVVGWPAPRWLDDAAEAVRHPRRRRPCRRAARPAAREAGAGPRTDGPGRVRHGHGVSHHALAHGSDGAVADGAARDAGDGRDARHSSRRGFLALSDDALR